METISIIIKLIGFIIISIGVIMIYDARKISTKWFSYGDRNTSVKTLKTLGFIISIIGGIIVILNVVG